MLLNTILLVTVFGLFLLLIDLYYDRIEKEVRDKSEYLITFGPLKGCTYIPYKGVKDKNAKTVDIFFKDVTSFEFIYKDGE